MTLLLRFLSRSLRIAAAVFAAAGVARPAAALDVIDLGKRFDHEALGCLPGLFHHIESDDDVNGGNTSIRREGGEFPFWKADPNGNGYGYYRRDRDLGQVFSVPTAIANAPEADELAVRSITVRTALGTKAVGDVDDAPVRVQLFEVVSEDGGPRVDENDTPPGTPASHGWDMSYNRADDKVVGVRYEPRFLSQVGRMPPLPATSRSGIDRSVPGRPTASVTEPGHLRYLRFEFDPALQPRLHAGRRYAFLIGFDEPGLNRRFALANQVVLGGVSVFDRQSAPALMTDPNGAAWWGLRREGNGQLPPTMLNQPAPPSDAALRRRLLAQAAFPDDHYHTVAPSSEGYPDVDTYRVFQFYVETVPASGE